MSTFKINTNNLSNICRVCLEKSKKLYPLEGSIINTDEYISTMISFCTSIEVVIDEDLPNGVCVPCFKIIRIAYNFIKEFKESNNKLLAERELKKNTIIIKEELREDEDIQLEESVLNDTSDDSYVVKSEEENLIVTYINENSPNSDDDKIPLENEMEEIFEENVKEVCGNNIEVIYEDDKSNLKVDEDICDKISKDNLTLYTFSCPVCFGKAFGDFKKGLVRHLHKDHRNALFKCDKCSLEAELSVDLYIQHYSKSHLYRCSICNKKLKSKATFNSHMRNHREGAPSFHCPHENCNKSFQIPLYLRKHLEVHSDIAKYICSKCGKKFKTYDTFRYHNLTHDGTRRHLCNVCGRAFLQSVHLKYHMWHHTGVKQFRCADCDRSYTSVTQLKKHRRKYCGSGKTNEKTRRRQV